MDDSVNLSMDAALIPSSSDITISAFQTSASRLVTFNHFAFSWHFLAFYREATAGGAVYDGISTPLSTTLTLAALSGFQITIGGAYLGVIGGVSLFARQTANQFLSGSFFWEVMYL